MQNSVLLKYNWFEFSEAFPDQVNFFFSLVVLLIFGLNLSKLLIQLFESV